MKFWLRVTMQILITNPSLNRRPGAVARLFREEANFGALDSILRHYEEVLEFPRGWESDRAGERASIVDCLRRIAPLARILEECNAGARSGPPSMVDVLGDLQRDLTRFQKELKEYS
mgnify:CR=1 FL=1